ncbi:benzoyl-CoA reductase subunit B [bacterium]|nr:benzoyl-CoA reductase subunit B [bacterium]
MSTIHKEESMVMQKTMIADHFEQLARAQQEGRKVVYTFVPGNLTELILAFDLLPVHPEINALQSGMRKISGDYIREAERLGHSEDVCTYVKCDVGMLMKGNLGPTGRPLPPPDLLLLSYTGCFTFMKWFEILRSHYDCPVIMIQVPYQGDGRITPEMTDYVSEQLRKELVPALEKLSGKRLDEERLRALLQRSRVAEENLVWALESAKRRPSPIDAYFGGVYYIGPIFTAFRGTQACVDYYALLRREIEARLEAGQGPLTPDGLLAEEKYRVVVEGPPNWTSFREFWKMFYDEGAVVVASSYTKVGGTYDRGFRHDPARPFASLAEYCLGCYTNLNLPDRVQMLTDYVRDYAADGFLINSIKSCNSFSAGQLLILREVERRTGKPGGFIESDLVDPRYFSGANIKNRLESYFQMIDLKRQEQYS